MEASGLSIINSNPTRQSGPELLHHLVKPPSNETALEHLANGVQTSYSYHELHEKADRLASRITQCRQDSNAPDEPFVVPVLIHQSPLLYISLLAILKAGAAFCPLNIDAPPERVRFIFNDVSATVALVSDELVSKIPSGTGADILTLSNTDGISADLPTPSLVQNRTSKPGDVAYVMYTSGSTGTPKGVALSHSAATQALLAHDRHLPRFSRFLQFAAPTFDVSVFEIFFPLFRGSTLISVSRQEMLDDLPSVLRRMHVDSCELTPTVAASLLRKRQNAPELRLLLTIGEMLNSAVTQEFGGDTSKDSMLWAMYGPTEATIHCTLQTAFLSQSSTGNIGFPLDTVSCFVVAPAESPEASTSFEVLPMGEVGELAVGGHQLANGYLNRPEQTSAVFISSPYGRVYRTGDKARMRPDGTLECLGRISDGQVKLRGQRLELGEVEQAAMRTPGCHNAVSAVVDSILIAFCAVDVGVTQDQILESCESWLPNFMVPGEFCLLPELPRLPSGKVDRKKLKSDFQEQKSAEPTDQTDQGPRDALTEKALHIVSETVRKKVSMETTLSSVGVDSLNAIRLASALRDAGFNIHAAKILTIRTVSDLCASLRMQPMHADPGRVDLSMLASLEEIAEQNPTLHQIRSEVEDIFPCVPLQLAMLSETLREPYAYYNDLRLAIAPGYTAEQVALAFGELARRNQILRTFFLPWMDGFVSILLKELPQELIEIVSRPSFSEFDFPIIGDALPPFQISIDDQVSHLGTEALIRIHHALYDGWSMDMMLTDVSKILEGALPQSRTQFGQVVQFHNQVSTREMADGDRAFWGEHLLEWSSPRFPMLIGRSPGSNQTQDMTKTFDIDPRRVELVARQNGYSPQVFFQASLALIWSGILGTSDVVIGSVTSGRSIPVAGADSVLGPCIASMPLRVNFGNMSTNLDALNSIRSSNRAILEHCILPPSEIKRLAGLQLGDSLYDLLFVYQESADTKNREEKLIKEVWHFDRVETKLLFEVEPRETSFAVQVTYAADSVSSEMVSLLLQQLESVVAQFLQDITGAIQATRMIPETSLSVFNEDPDKLQGTHDLAQAFEAAVRRTPNSNAICFAASLEIIPVNVSTISYHDLNQRSNRVARFLLSRGGNTGDIVAIVMEKSVDLYASILGIVKAGCAYLPLLPSTPGTRVREIFEQAGIKHCFVDGKPSQTFDRVPQVQLLDISSVALEEFEPDNLNIPPDSSRLAYVIYTSGTTGVPKGVAITQRNIVSNITHLQSTYPMRSAPSESRLLQACSQAFDVSVFEIFYTWCAGMCLCAGENDLVFGDLEHAIRQLDITHLSLTPTVASLIDPKNVPRVQFLITAGEPMTLAVLDRWGGLLWQGYGPSETTNICSVKQMSRGDYIEHLGWAFPNTSAFVLRPNSFEVMPRGWVGEFCFGGDQIAQGYLNMPQVTTDKFIEHPTAGRIYRSGDMGRMLPDGSLVILGRIDDQIKLRGQRIEASEIDSIITGTKLATSAVTMLGRRDEKSPQQLVSFYVPENLDDRDRDSRPLEIQTELNRDIMASVHARVPSYMVPSYLISVPLIPLTSSGKVDRKALQHAFEKLPRSYLVSASAMNQESTDDAEWSATEISIADVVSQRFGIPASEIGRWTPFATFGLDSISAIGVARNLSFVLAVQLPISAILQNPSIAQLGRYVGNMSSAVDDASSRVQMFAETFVNDVKESFSQKSRKVTEVLPCTPLQEAMLSSGEGSYYNKILFRLRIGSEQMREYWTGMSRRHGVLRTCFITTSDTSRPIAQVTFRDWTIPWRTFEVSVPTLEGAIHEHLQGLPEPLDSHLPPLSLALIRYKGSEFLSFICHHALYDGVAMENLWREVEALANGNSLAPPVPYRPFIQEILSLPADVDNFWRNQLNGFQSSTLFNRPARKQIDQCTHTTSLDMPFGEVQDRLRSFGISLISLCQAAWVNVLAVACDGQDICFGNVMSGRTLGIEGLDRLVAPCFNTIPVRKDISTISQNLDLVKYFHRLNSDLLRYQFTPLRHIQKIANRQRRGLFDTLLLLQQPLNDMDETVWTLEEDSGDMDIPVVCEVVPCPNLNLVVVNLHHDMSIVTGEIAATLSDTFRYLLKSILTSPYTAPMTRQTLPTGLSSGLSGLVARKEKREELDQAQRGQEEWSGYEAQIRKVLSELSGTPASKIRRVTTIFQLGLDSINAVQVASLLRGQGLSISATDIIECLSCASIARRLLENSQHRKPESASYNLDNFAEEVEFQVKSTLPGTIEIEAVLPCTPMQSAMLWSFAQSGGQNYLNLMTYEVDRSITVDSLREAWERLYAWHPMLRTAFLSVQHRDTAHAMVRQAATSIEPPITTLNSEEGRTFNIKEWKARAGQDFLTHPQLLPWKIALVRGKIGPTMHFLVHHALYDAQSLDAIQSALLSFLRQRSIGKFLDLRPGLSFMLTQTLRDQDTAEEFWQKQASKVVVNSFPVLTPLRESKRVMLSYETTSSMSFSDLHRKTRHLNYSIQAVIQAAWTRVLSSYLGESSVVFGVSLSGRTSDETKNTSLPCLVTLPVVASNEPSNDRLVKSMMEYNVNMHRHQFSPLSKVQKWLGFPATPVFDTLLAYQRMERGQVPAKPWKLVADEAMVDYPVSLEIHPEDDDRVQLQLTFLSDILPKEQAILIVQQFDATVAHLVGNPTGTVEETFRGQPQLVSIEPASSPEIPAPVKYLHQFVESMAASQPDATALEFVTGFKGEVPVRRTWSYQEFDRLGRKVANMLSQYAPVGSIIAVHFNKCPEAYFSILGILKAGCSFVALDPTTPAARKEFILRDSAAPCLLTDSVASINFEASAKTVLVSEDILQKCDAAARDLGDNFTPTNTCYCLYTSGTTGAPKGCEITHENAVQAMMAFQVLFKGHWTSRSRWLQFAALHFDVSVLEQYWSWSVGITVVAAPKDLILDDLIAAINRLDITHIDLTPSLARLTHPDDVPSLCRGVFITGGEQLKQEILDAWGPKAVIYNAYGPTEATIGVTMYERVPVNGRPSNIGKQFPNVGSYVFHQETEIPVLRGGVGELCVSGKLVGKGYLKRPELTEERFPALAEFGERVYRTGDLVRILHDGCFEFLGRADDQVKLRGQRLEIGEINHAIRSGAPQIQDVATIVTRHGSSGKDVLVTFLVAQGSEGQALRVLRDEELGPAANAACRDRLPSYMVPTYFLRLPYIPLSPNNKAEVKELKNLFSQLSHDELMELSASLKPTLSRRSGETADRLMHILSDFSSIDRGTMTEATSIFDLGVDSITAFQLASFLRGRGFQTAMPAMLLRNPIIADLAEALDRVSPEQNSSFVREAKHAIQACHHRYRGLVCRELGVKPGDIEYIAPCSALQQGIVSEAMTGREQGAYFNSFELKLADKISKQRLRKAWGEVVASQAILRTAFVNTASGCVQVALKGQPPVWEEHEVDSTEAANVFIDAKRAKWIVDNGHHVKTSLQIVYLEEPTRRRLIMNIFHAIYDGNSFDLIFEQAVAAYHGNGFTSGPPFIKTLAYGPLWKHTGCQQFWIDHLRDWTFSPIPPVASANVTLPTVASRTISTSSLEKIRQRHGVTLQAVLLALWTAALQRMVDDAPTVGVVVAGRSIDLLGVERTVGPLFNTVPFFSRAPHGRSWSSLIQAAHEFNTSIMPFQHVPLQSIQKWCSHGKPLFDNLFTLHLEQDEQADQPVAPWEVMESPPSPDYPLAFEANRVSDGRLELLLVTKPHVADPLALEELLDVLEEYIEYAARDPAQVLVPREGADRGEQDKTQKAPDHDARGDIEVPSFTWTEHALTIRSQLATMVDIPAEDIDAHTTILALGLDSVDVVKLSAGLRRKRINLSASQILRQQTIANMAQLAGSPGSSTRYEEDSDASLQDVQAKLELYARGIGTDLHNVEALLPPTSLQESMVADMVQSNFRWYFNHDILEIAENVELSRLREAWVRVVEGSPILRTGFLSVDDQDLDMAYCQIVFSDHTPKVREYSITGSTGFDEVLGDATSVAREGKAATDLFQLAFVTVDDKRYMAVSIAHALYDGWSLNLMYQDLEAAYRGDLRPRPSIKPFLSRATTSSTDNAQEFWAEYLDGVSPTLLPELEQTTSTRTSTSFEVERPSATPYGELADFCRTRSISLQILCQACWAMVVARRTRKLDVSFGVILSGRDIDGAESLMFPTMNTVALRCILHGSVAIFLTYLEETMAEIRDFQAFPLRKAKLAARTAGELFNSLFILQKSPDASSNTTLLRSVEGSAALDFPVCIEAEVFNDELVWRVACQATHFSEQGTNDLMSELDSVLGFMATQEASDVLSFQDSGVSICGLPAVTTVDELENEDYSSIEEDSAGPEEEWSPTASNIRRVLSQVSNVPLDSVASSSSLYHLGLDSISAIKISSLLRKQGIEIRPRDLIAATSIRQMAESAIEPSQPDDHPAYKSDDWTAESQLDINSLLAVEDLSRADVESIIPALPMQVYVLSVWQNTHGAVFFPEFVYRLEGMMDAGQVYEAWHSLVRQTPILRTRFVPTGLRDMPLLQAIVKSPLAQQPLVHFSVTRDTESVLLLRLKIHHALYDGVSLPAMLHKLSTILGANNLPATNVDLQSWERYCMKSTLPAARTRRRDFWTRYLAGCMTSIPATPSESWGPDERVSYLERSAVTDIALLRLNAAQNGISVQSLFFAAYAKELAVQRKQDGAIVFGIYLANRGENHGVDDMYPALNLVPLRVNIRWEDGLADVAKAIQDDIHSISTGGRADVGLWEIAEWTGVQLSSFVNFLSLPSQSTDEAAINLVQTEHTVERNSKEEPDRTRPWLAVREHGVRDVFPDAVDIEASIQEGGLDIGVFGSGRCVSYHDAEKLVERISATLEEVMHEPEP